ncbi:hypothetical protein [Acinetobacter baumannii]|uniref:hypothetical protein n=1 Tax=Acinetobacter baumannii TaxID=470 RepID=UPI00112AA48F|nr:hypothetical protein [Acinetobacter baumannii]TPU28007.1 hypothetical protein FJU85_16045 [Acinetobacter baumannii]
MRKYTNQGNIALALAVFLAQDSYDHEEDVISATTLLKPIRQTVLAKRVPAEDRLVDIAGLVSSRIGTAIHDGIERSWKSEQLPELLSALGYPSRVAKRVKVNPSKEDLDAGCIPVYMEVRSYREIEGVKISGKFDFIGEGMVQDFKSTSVFTYMNQTNRKKYPLQGSIYRWLNPELITDDSMMIHYIFTDWSGAKAKSEKDYPPSRLLSQRFNLLSLHETELFVRNRVRLLKKYQDAPESELPECTDEELWRKPTVWKYYKDKNKTDGRSTKNFDNKHDAFARFVDDGSCGAVREIKGQVVACKYCDAFPVCTQKDRLIADGSLVI